MQCLAVGRTTQTASNVLAVGDVSITAATIDLKTAYVALDFASNYGNSNSTTWQNTDLNAGQTINLNAQGDTTLRGAVARVGWVERSETHRISVCYNDDFCRKIQLGVTANMAKNADRRNWETVGFAYALPTLRLLTGAYIAKNTLANIAPKPRDAKNPSSPASEGQ